MELEKFSYDNKTVKQFAYATIFWGLIGMTVGLWVELQLVFPVLNFNTSFTILTIIKMDALTIMSRVTILPYWNSLFTSSQIDCNICLLYFEFYWNLKTLNSKNTNLLRHSLLFFIKMSLMSNQGTLSQSFKLEYLYKTFFTANC